MSDEIGMGEMTPQESAALAALENADGWIADDEVATVLGLELEETVALLTVLGTRGAAYRRRRQDIGPDVYEWKALT